MVAWCNILIVAKDSKLVASFMGFSSCGGGLSLAVVWLVISSCGVLVGYSLVTVCGLLSSYGEGLFCCNM